MSELHTRATLVNSRSGNKSHPSIPRQDSDEYDEVFLMGPPPPITSGGGGEYHPNTETTFHQEHVDHQVRSSWNEPGAGTLYTGGGGGGSPSIEEDDASTRAKLVHSAASLLADRELFKNRDDEFPVELATSTNLDSVMSEACATVGTSYYRHRQHRGSIFDDLLFEIYQRWHESHRDSLDSDTFTEYSSATEFAHYRSDSCHEGADRRIKKFSRSFLENQGLEKLRSIHANLRYSINQMSARLVRQLKRRDHRVAKLNCNCDLLTAFLQASSLKRRVDTRIKFSIEPPSTGENAYGQWVDAMKGVARLPLGIPEEFRKKVWLGLADNYIHEIHVDWEKTVSFAFNERCNPDDNKLGLQIVKDLHRTGCSSFSGRDNEEDRAVLKRVLLAYARWNKHVGYCQGFNVIAALLLDVFDRREDHALKVMIYLIDHVLPDSYFANNLRALSVDMAVFRDLLHWKFPPLSRHLDNLQRAAQEEASGPIYEPPLTNVFTMQWFLTLFATCLPKKTVLRMWDSILLEGSEILLRAALVIWGKLAKRIMSVGSADEFYTLMGELSQDMVNGDAFSPDRLIKSIYSISPFPFPQLGELREKYTYNIRPFTGDVGNSVKKASKSETGNLGSDEDDLDDEDMEAIRCFTGIFHMQSMSSTNKAKAVDQEANGGSSCSSSDISVMGPGVYGTAAPTDAGTPAKSSVPMERMTTDLSALKKQYMKLRQRQTQAHIILTGLACATVSCERVSPVSEARDEGSMPLNTCLLNSISLDSSCSNPVSPAMSDGASSLASFFETNSESLKTSGDDEKTPQSVSPLPSEHCWDAGITMSPVINTPNNRRTRSHSYCSRDALSPTEKIGIEFNIARINGNSLCNQNTVDCVGRVRSHSTKSELSPSDPITSDSLESLSSITSEGNIYNKVSIPKLAARQSVSPSQAYLNKHCAINGMKLGLYKPSVLKTANKKQKPSLQSMFSKS